jgi:ribosomal protein S12 methylthiotransferase accessory factor
LCFLGYGDEMVRASTNGCAAAPSWDDAVTRGLLELIERDAVAIWWYNRTSRPAVALRSIDSPRLRSLDAIARGLARRWWLLDVTTDIDIPVMLAVSTDQQGRHLMFGSAADCDVERAAYRAGSEMIAHCWQLTHQQQLIKRQLSRPGDRPIWDWWRKSNIRDHPHTVASPDPPITAEMYASLPRRRRALDHCLERIERIGLDVFIKDHTNPATGVPVARVIVPGLRPWSPRFAPGRLYDVPVKLGWFKTRLTEPRLNPIEYFL